VRKELTLSEIERCYTLLRSRRDELAEGWVWIRDRHVEDLVRRRRPIAEVSHTSHGKVKRVYCEMVYADDNDLAALNASFLARKPDRRAVFMSSWYREKLGIEWNHPPNKCVLLTIDLRRARSFSWQILACADHPQVVIRLATWLGLLGLGLGVIGVGLGFLPLGVAGLAIGIVVLIAGIVETVLSTSVFWKRRLTTPGAVDISGNDAATRIVPQ